MNRPEKTGLARFWELIKDELPAVLIVNVLFLVTCIPIVTIPPALFSLHAVIRRIILSEGVSCAEDYFTAFRQGWKRAYGAFFLVAVPMGVAGYGAVFYLRRMTEYPVLLVPFAFCTTVFLVQRCPPPICSDLYVPAGRCGTRQSPPCCWGSQGLCGRSSRRCAFMDCRCWQFCFSHSARHIYS